MEIFRITKSDYANLDGVGGLMVSGRWHDKGNKVVYFSENRALAILEYLVHIGDSHLLPSNLVLLSLEVPGKTEYITIQEEDLTALWQSKLLYTRNIGSNFLKENKNLLLKIPSVIVKGEYNFLLNPSHNQVKNCNMAIQPFIYDERIWKGKDF